MADTRFSVKLNDHDLRVLIIDELVARGVESVGHDDPATFADEIMVKLGFTSAYDTRSGDYTPGYEEYAKSVGLIRDHEHCREIGACWQNRYPCPALSTNEGGTP